MVTLRSSNTQQLSDRKCRQINILDENNKSDGVIVIVIVMECEDWESRRSLVRSLKILLTVESAGLVLTLTAGSSLIAQLGEFSQCILFSYKGRHQAGG